MSGRTVAGLRALLLTVVVGGPCVLVAGCSGDSSGTVSPTVTSPAQVRASRGTPVAGAAEGAATGGTASASVPGGAAAARPPSRPADDPSVPKPVAGYTYAGASDRGTAAAADLRRSLKTVVDGVAVRGVMKGGRRIADVVMVEYPAELSASPMFRSQTVNSAIVTLSGASQGMPQFETYGETAVQVVQKPRAALAWSTDDGMVVVLSDGASLAELRAFVQRYPRPE
jgi:hypothetical protein